jgi:hypothetical protein
MKMIHTDHAVSEILGMVLLLAIATLAVSTLYINILSDPGPSGKPEVTLVGKLESENVIFNHIWGEALNLETKILFDIAGQSHGPLNIGDLIEEESRFDGVWNIGEQLIYNAGNMTGLQVKATIFEPESDQLIWWGTLQEGYIVSPHGRGGIWHFDESSWTSIPNEVLDSSGNGNHGRALNGAKINVYNPDNPDLYVSGNSGFFDGLDDYVQVKVQYPYSLDITEEITVEAWVKPMKINPFLDETAIYEKFGFTPTMIRVSGQLFAIVSEDSAKGAMIQTVNFNMDGEIEYTGFNQILDKSISSKNLRPEIIHITNNIFAISYIDKQSDVKIRTVSILDSGEVSLTGFEKIFFDSYPNPDPSDPHRPRIIGIMDDIYLVAYRNINNQGTLRTITISENGEIQDTGYRLAIDGNPSHEPRLQQISESLYCVVYRDMNNQGVIKTFNVTNDGKLVFTGYELVFDSNEAWEPSVQNISENIIAIAYRGELNKGNLKTFKIAPSGQILHTGHYFIFEHPDIGCYEPYIDHYKNDAFVIVYASGSRKSGYLISVEIIPTGEITGIIEKRVEFEIDKCYNPYLIEVLPRIIGIIYEGKDPGGAHSGHPGELKTYLIEDNPTPPNLRGIVKAGSVSLYADMNYVYGSINGPNQMITIPINNQSWNHIAITYDQSKIRLYCSHIGGTQKATLNYKGLIYSSGNKLLFGNLFSGYLDEIAIYDQMLTEAEIMDHYNNPGEL